MRLLFSNLLEGRLRTFWRLLLTLLLSFVLYWLLSSAAVIMLVVVLLAERALPAGGDVAGRYSALAAMPLVQIISLGMALCGTFFAAWVAARFWDRRRFADFGFHFSPAWRRDLLFGLCLGGMLAGGVFVLERAAGWPSLAARPGSGGSPPSFAAVLVAPFAGLAVAVYQELLVRGYLLRNLAEGLAGRWIGARTAVLLAWWLSSLAYALARAGGPGPDGLRFSGLALLSLTALSGFFGLGYLLTGELALPIGLHVAWFVFSTSVLGLAAPAQGLFAGVLVGVRQAGPAVWTGGALGPDAGLAGLLAAAAGSLSLLLWVRASRGRLVLRTELTHYVPAPSSRAAELQPAPAGSRRIPQKGS